MNRLHDRLDLKLSTLEYTDPRCGTPNSITGKKDYCGPDCPTFVKDNVDIARGLPEIFKRMKELIR